MGGEQILVGFKVPLDRELECKSARRILFIKPLWDRKEVKNLLFQKKFPVSAKRLLKSQRIFPNRFHTQKLEMNKTFSLNVNDAAIIILYA
jgi:hypothetical protein